MSTRTEAVVPTPLHPFLSAGALLIGLLAVATIGLALAIDASGLVLESSGLSDPVEYSDMPLIHGAHLLLVAIALAGLAYMHTQDPDLSLRGLLNSVGIGVGIATIILAVTDSITAITTIVDTLTLSPTLTGIAGLAGVAYYGALHTQYDWMAVNVAGLLILPPLIAHAAGVSLSILVAILVGMAVFDFYAVHKSTTMEKIANSMIPLRLPVAYFVPTTAASLSDSVDNDGVFTDEFRMLGMGDVAIPGIFIVATATTFAGPLPLPTVLAFLGYIVAYGVLISDPFEKPAYAALPFLNTGVLLGAVVALPFV